MVDNNSQELDPDLDLGLDVPLSSQDSFSELWNDVVVNSSIYTNYANTDEDENRMEIECEKLIIAAPNNAEALVSVKFFFF